MSNTSTQAPRLRKADGWLAGRCKRHSDAADLVKRLHYSRGCANTSVLASGLVSPDLDLVGAALWMPPPPGSAKWVARKYGCSSSKVITLSRMVIEDQVPKNGASFLLGWGSRELRRLGWQVAVTFADPLEGHTGGVYLACGWTRDGESSAAPRWTDPEGRMRSRHSTKGLTVADMLSRGWGRIPGRPKPRFIKIL